MLSRQQSLDHVVLGAGPREHLFSLVLPDGTPASNLESQVLGEPELKVGPNRTARGAFLKPQGRQEAASKGQEPHLYPPHMYCVCQVSSYLRPVFSYTL